VLFNRSSERFPIHRIREDPYNPVRIRDLSRLTFPLFNQILLRIGRLAQRPTPSEKPTRGFHFRAVRPLRRLLNFAESLQDARLCILLLLLSAAFSTASAAGSLQLTWNASTESNLAGYVLYYGASSGQYTQSITVGNTLTATVQNLTAGRTYYFAVAAYETTGMASAPSNEVVYTVPTGSSAVAASATFVGSDTSTHGNWKGVYGADGFSLAGDATSYPAYATVTNIGSLTYTWTAFTSDVRALQKASSTGRLAACWYAPTLASGASYTIDVNLTDGNSHQIGFYVLDWDGYGPRAETVQLTDATSGTVLDSEPVSSFQEGGYLIWTVRGHVKINVTNNVPGTNAVASGLLFDPAGTTQPIPAG